MVVEVVLTSVSLMEYKVDTRETAETLPEGCDMVVFLMDKQITVRCVSYLEDTAKIIAEHVRYGLLASISKQLDL